MARLVVAAVLLAGSAAAGAQQRSGGGCRAGEPPFELTPANQIKGAELRTLLPGKRLFAERQMNDRKRANRFGFEFRADGSLVFTCRGAGGQACPQFTPGTGGRDVGVWRIEGDQIVLQRTRFAEQGRVDGRVTLHRKGGTYAGGRTSAPHFCLPGLIIVE
jgi:hypothetical protein